MILLLVHGWGFDQTFWRPLQAALGDLDSVAWDLGYHGHPSRPPLPAGRPIVAVGHSFGLLWLLHERPVAWHALASINGFPCFTRRRDFPAGVAPRLLERMIGRLGQAPDVVYREFMQRCGVAAPQDGDLDAAALAQGLTALAEWDARGAGHGVDLALAGQHDPIAPAALTAAAFEARCIEWRDGGHLLPLDAPDWCARHLRRMVGRLSAGGVAEEGGSLVRPRGSDDEAR
jgi:pimeloyl-[acyl-carrier protein] methyl ester esterase